MAVVLVMLCGLAMPAPAKAFDAFNKSANCGGEQANTAACQAGTADPISGSNGLLFKITHIVTYVAGSLAVIFIIYGGIKYITANGDTGKVKSARDTVVYSLIGLAVIAITQQIINYVVLQL